MIEDSQFRWNDPVMATDADDVSHGDVNDLLSAPGSSGAQTLFILAVGFDPRCSSGLLRYIGVNGAAPHVIAVEPQALHAGLDAEMVERRRENELLIQSLAVRSHTVVKYPSVHDDSSAGRIISQTLTRKSLLAGITTIVFDLSSFPTSLAFPPLKGLLRVIGSENMPTELQVIVTENPTLDAAIVHSSLGEAHPLPGFGSRTKKSQVRVWTPVLGSGAGPSLSRIAEALDPQEVCPILPFPARDPRLVDNLVLEHRELLLDRLRVPPSNFIYAAETNPFDLYRTLVRYDLDCQESLAGLGGAQITVSSHGSKLLSVGVLLASIERGLSFYAVRANVRTLADDYWRAESRADDRLACLWLAGEPYVS